MLFMSNTNHLCKNLLAKGLKDQRKKKMCNMSLAIARADRKHPKSEFRVW